MDTLVTKACVPCQVGAPRLEGKALRDFMTHLQEGWELIDEGRIVKTYSLPSFMEAIEFVRKIGKLAEKEGHHPDLHVSYDKVKVELWTHKIGGLHENDFILAAKIDHIFSTV